MEKPESYAESIEVRRQRQGCQGRRARGSGFWVGEADEEAGNALMGGFQGVCESRSVVTDQ